MRRCHRPRKTEELLAGLLELGYPPTLVRHWHRARANRKHRRSKAELVRAVERLREPTITELARALRRRPQSVGDSIERLVVDGVLVARRSGRAKLISINQNNARVFGCGWA
jgi:DNA-binding MarR family transcriptional regulator